jgi:hypothetical protein
MSYDTGGWRRTKPKRRHRSLEEFRCRHFVDGSPPGHKQWPCLRRLGRAFIPDPRNTSPLPEDSCCDQIVCPECHGTGIGPKSAIVEAYWKYVAEFQAEEREYAQLVKARQEAIDILNPIQVQAIKELGI